MQVTNADRIVFPDDGITKGDVHAYYRRVAHRILPFLEDRPLTVERYPKGLGGAGFMQKNAPDHYPPDVIGRFEASREGGATTTYPVIESVEGIEFFANLGVISFHVPNVKVGKLHHPDWLIWDLDPPAGEVEMVRNSAVAVRNVLESFGLFPALMTSGSKGYHLRVPLVAGSKSAEAAEMAHGVAAIAAAAHPDLLTLAFRKAERRGRVFVDWLRNNVLATAVAPWSLRARRGAPLAAPLGWEELNEVEPGGITLRNVRTRLERDQWAEIELSDIRPVTSKLRRALDTLGIELQPFDRFRS